MPITIYKRGIVWHYRGSVAGRRLRGSTRTASKERAQRIAADKEAQAWKCHTDGPESTFTFAQAAIKYRRAGKPTRYLRVIEDYWRDTLVRDIMPGNVKELARALYPHVKPATRNRQVIVPTQAVINHSAELGLCNKISVKRFPVAKVEKEPATWAWVQAFMKHSNPHLGALCCFMFLTGARITEALSVTWDDMDLSRRRALIRQSKLYDEERYAHLPQPLVVAIANINSNREMGTTVFKYSSRNTAKPQWRKAIKRSGIKRLSFHACRHGFATAMLHAGIDPVTIAKRGGWKDAYHVLKTYGHAMEDETVTDRIAGKRDNENVPIPSHRKARQRR